MSTSFLGFNPGRNCGMRGRVSNVAPHLMMNPKAFVHKLNQPIIQNNNHSNTMMEIDTDPKKEFFEEHNLRMPTHSRHG